MKTFLDRLFFYYHPKTKPRISGKKAIIVTPMNQQNVFYESEILVSFYTRLLNCLGINKIDMFFFGDIMTKKNILQKPKYLKEAYAIGKNILSTISNGNTEFQKTSIQIIKGA
ncbi:MAG: hypothetical protein ABIK92_12920 [Pseudomonadota bacterium]